MFELFLNTAKLVVSKDTRESAAALISALRRSPDWRSDDCTLVANIPAGCRDEARLLRGAVCRKAIDLSYPRSCVKRIGLVYRELVCNAIEHGTSRAVQKTIRIVVQVSPTLISITVYNPGDVPVHLKKWFTAALQHLEATKKRSRGRGLLMVREYADELEIDPPLGVRAVVYRDNVVILVEECKGDMFVVVKRGHANPSAARRVINAVRRAGEHEVIICLDPAKYDIYRGFATAVEDPEDPEDLDFGSRNYEILDTYIDRLKKAKDVLKKQKDVKVVVGDPFLLDMLSRDTFFASVENALDSLRYL